MSVDVIGPDDPILPTGGPRIPPPADGGPITDLIVVFGGWGAQKGGEPLDPNANTGASRLLKELMGLTGSAGRRLRVIGYEGSLVFGTPEPLRILRDLFHPAMKLIVYGFSAGGRDANVLGWQVWQDLRYYEFSTGRFYAYLGKEAFRRSTIGITRVDLLITVDAAFGPFSGGMFRNVAPAVRRSVNYFQTSPSGTARSGVATGPRSHGGPSQALQPTATLVENHNLDHLFQANPGGGHGAIDEATMPDVLKLVRAELGLEVAPPLPVPPGPASP